MTTTTFRLRRPLITSNGITSDIDPVIQQHLMELDKLLGKRVFTTIGNTLQNDFFEVTDSAKKLAKGKHAGTASGDVTESILLSLSEELKKPIYPKKTTSDNWDNRGLLNTLYNNPENEELLNISECIDRVNKLANLKYEYQDYITQNWNFLSSNYRAILNYNNISDYLLAYAYFVKGISEINGLNHFIDKTKNGLQTIINYAIISTARYTIQKESLKIDSYNDDEHPLMQKILDADLSLSKTSFSKALNKILDDYVYNSDFYNTDYSELIAKSSIKDIPSSYIPLLIKYIKKSPVKIDASNINNFLPLYLNEIKSSTIAEDAFTPIDESVSEKDFDVEFFQDDKSVLLANTSNVKCAAQLYYCMVLGEEMDVFNLMNYFTHKFLINKRVDIHDPSLRQDIQTYVFSNKFTDFKTGRLMERTRPAERQMFYRQVFNIGSAPVSEDVIVNTDFPKLWKVMILESYDYLEKAQESPNPDSFVSRQNVMQAVEELMYNLSANCTGMATVFSPMIYSELRFVIDKIFNHPEVLMQVSPTIGTWKHVLENLWADMKQSRFNSQFTYNKAMFSQSIITRIADYTPSAFEQDDEFSAFISDVTALISTQSNIQQNLRRGIVDDGIQENKGISGNGYSKPAPVQTPEPAESQKDEWDF